MGLQIADLFQRAWRQPHRQFNWKAFAADLLASVLPSARRRRSNARMQSVLAALPAATDCLDQASSDLERQFLATGETLQELRQLGQQFMKGSEQLITVAIGQSHGKDFIANGTRVIEEPLVFLERCLVESERLLSQLRQACQGIEALLLAEVSLRRTMAPLKTIQTLFRIECAPLGVEAQTMFTALTQEIERMHNQVCELFDTKFTELKQVQQILNVVGVKLEHQTINLRNFVTTEKTQIRDSLRQLADELASNQQREVRIRNLSREVTRAIQDVIVGLQFQDIINQKLQHTGAAVTQIMERFGEDDEALHFLVQSCRLEAEQLKAVRADLAKAEQTVKAGIANIIEHLSEADTNCLSLKEFDQVTASSDGMIQVLLGLVESVRNQVTDMSQRTAEIKRPLQPIQNMAAGLTLVVRNLSYGIHLIGLNAQAQAAHFSHGAGLEVLSARTSEISQETNRISEMIATHLDQLAAGLTENVKTFDQLHTQAISQQEWLADSGAEVVNGLHKLRDEGLTTLQEVGELLEQIQRQANEALGAVRYVETADTKLTALQTQLQNLGEGAVGKLGERHDPTKNLLAGFRRNYTMDSERHIYNQVVQGTKTEAPPQCSAPPAASDVEFFGADVPTNTVAPAVEPEPISAMTEPLPPQDLTSAPAPLDGQEIKRTPVTTLVKGGDLGDNVEMF